MVRRVDPKSESLLWCKEVFVLCGCCLGPKRINCCRPEKKDTSQKWMIFIFWRACGRVEVDPTGTEDSVQNHFSEWICEQIMNVAVPQVDAQDERRTIESHLASHLCD